MKRLLMASVAALTLTAATASAQTTPELDGLVNVNIEDVLQDIAVDLSIEETNIPVTLQVPVSVAANVCDVDVSVLTAQVDAGEATCAAVTGSQELTQIVQQEMAAGGSIDDGEDTADSGDETPTEDTADSGEDTTTDETADTGDDSIDDGATDEDTASTDDGMTDDGEDTADAGDSETDETTTGSVNSAKEFAPGQQDVPAKEVAPGQLEDPQAAAPGQIKKIEEQ